VHDGVSEPALGGVDAAFFFVLLGLGIIDDASAPRTSAVKRNP
jgi:hypothetical protein